MKEKSKNAAKNRREKENVEFVALSKLLPLPVAISDQLDKASLIRLTISFLRLRAIFPQGIGGAALQEQCMKFAMPPQLGCFRVEPHRVPTATHSAAPSFCDVIEREIGSFLLQSLEGFVFVLGSDGKIVYISETASVHLGLSQVEMTGSSVFEFVHANDHEELKAVLAGQSGVPANQGAPIAERHSSNPQYLETECNFCVRIKCVLPKRNAGLTQSGYKLIHCNGFLKSVRSFYQDDVISSATDCTMALLAVAHSIPANSFTDLRLSSHMFVIRTALDLHITHVDSRTAFYLGYDQSDVMNTSLYQIVHPENANSLRHFHSQLLVKGQGETAYLRLLDKDGSGWVWTQIQAVLVQNTRSSRPNSITLINYAISKEHLGGQTRIFNPPNKYCCVQSDSPSNPINCTHQRANVEPHFTDLREQSINRENRFYQGAVQFPIKLESSEAPLETKPDVPLYNDVDTRLCYKRRRIEEDNASADCVPEMIPAALACSIGPLQPCSQYSELKPATCNNHEDSPGELSEHAQQLHDREFNHSDLRHQRELDYARIQYYQKLYANMQGGGCAEPTNYCYFNNYPEMPIENIE